MADNTALNAGTGGDTIATDDIAGVKHQRVKIQYGDDGAATDVSDTNPLPIDDAGGSITVDGTVTANLSATDNAVLDTIDAVLDTINAKLVTGTVIGDVNLGATDNAVLDSIDSAVNGTLTVAAHDVTNAGTFAVQVSDTSFAVADGNALGEGVLVQGDDGTDRKNINVDATTGDVQVDVTNTVTVDGSGVTQPVSGTITETNSAAILADTAAMDTNLGTVAGAVAAGQMQVDIVADGAGLLTTSAHDAAFGTAGAADAQVRTVQGVASMTPLLVDATGQGDVPITLSGETVTLAAGTNTNEVVGDVAHDVAAAGNPVAIAARATNSVEGLTQVAAADATYVTSDLNGCLVNRPHTTLEENLSERVSNTNGTSTAFSTFGAPGANTHNYITDITVHNAHASTNGYVDIRDGTAGSVLWTLPLPAGGGTTHSFSIPLKQPTADTALAYDVSAAITTVYISVNGFQAQG